MSGVTPSHTIPCHVALHGYTAVLLGIVLLMTTKPPMLATSTLAVAVALALGLASGLPLVLGARAGARSRRAIGSRSSRHG